MRLRGALEVGVGAERHVVDAAERRDVRLVGRQRLAEHALDQILLVFVRRVGRPP